jgi:hypothetical protein
MRRFTTAAEHLRTSEGTLGRTHQAEGLVSFISDVLVNTLLTSRGQW